MSSETQKLQTELLESIQNIYEEWALEHNLSDAHLYREKHVAYLLKGFLKGFPAAYVSLDASRPWLVYWSLQAFDLLNALPTQSDPGIMERCIETLKDFQVPGKGGFGGGSQNDLSFIPHLAPTFASVSALAVLQCPAAFDLINRSELKQFMKRLKCPRDGSFRMHEDDGEIDTRAAYCAVVSGKLTGVWDEELEAGLLDWIISCQTWEGGFAGVPCGAEAHGGYTYCALAALCLIDPTTTRAKINMPCLMSWLGSQQVASIGGFRGRTNKLVDGCYSFWLAACFQLVKEFLLDSSDFRHLKLFDTTGLQKYILLACQNEIKGGLRDKPGKNEDFYHTCYCLSGLSVAQHHAADEGILGGEKNRLQSVDVRFNLTKGKAEAMMTHFSAK